MIPVSVGNKVIRKKMQNPSMRCSKHFYTCHFFRVVLTKPVRTLKVGLALSGKAVKISKTIMLRVNKLLPIRDLCLSVFCLFQNSRAFLLLLIHCIN